MTVKLRKRALSVSGRYALYLDLYCNGKQWQENLKLYLEPEKNDPIAKQSNKQTMDLAKRIQTKRLLEIQNDGYGIKQKRVITKTFNEYVTEIAQEKKRAGLWFDGWDSAIKHLNKFNSRISFNQITDSFLEEFRGYLLQRVKPNSALAYFGKIKAAIHKAYRERIINDNPALRVKSPKEVDTNRQYLSKDELQKLIDTECRYEVLKRAFLFSCLTGLRWSDIHALTWGEIQQIEGVHHIIYTQKKTKNAEVLPISDSAYNLLGIRGEDDCKVFVGLQYSSYFNTALFTWVANAGIKKHITFHCARHTNAVLLLNNGVDIYTVSKMLGHRELKTTQIYAKVISKTKLDAIEKLPTISF